MEEKIEKFMGKYKELKELVTEITKTLDSYIDEVETYESKFNEFLSEYSFKISATVYGSYDDEKEKISALLDDIDKLIKEDKTETFKDFGEYFNELRTALNKFEKSYDDEDIGCIQEMQDLSHDIDQPFEDLEVFFDEDDWDYDEY